MSKEELLEFKGIVLEVLPDVMFRVELEDSKHIVVAHASGSMRQNRIKILKGDSVLLETSMYDLTKGRIISRLGNRPQNPDGSPMASNKGGGKRPGSGNRNMKKRQGK